LGLKAQVEASSGGASSSENKAATLSSQLEEQRYRADLAETNFKGLQVKHQQLESKAESLEQDLQTARAKRDEYQALSADLERKVGVYAHESEKTSSAAGTKGEKVTQLESELEAARNKNRALELRAQQAEDRSNDLERKHNESSAKSGETGMLAEEYKRRITSLETSNDKLEKANNQLESQLKEATEELRQVKVALSSRTMG